MGDLRPLDVSSQPAAQLRRLIQQRLCVLNLGLGLVVGAVLRDDAGRQAKALGQRSIARHCVGLGLDAEPQVQRRLWLVVFEQ